MKEFKKKHRHTVLVVSLPEIDCNLIKVTITLVSLSLSLFLLEWYLLGVK